METNPIAPRQRNRRADRSAPAEQAIPAPMQQAPAQQTPPAQPQMQPVYQSPRTMYQQAPMGRPGNPGASGYPQAGMGYPQSGYPQQGYPQQTGAINPQGTPAAAPRPRALNQPTTVESGWQQPVLPNEAGAAPARTASFPARETARSNQSTRPRESMQRLRKFPEPHTDQHAKKKIPGWVTTALSLALILVLAFGAAYWLMQAYLTTQENARIAAYEAVLENHHVTKEADGTLRVTWQDYIEKYAAQYNLQPAFVTAIIRNESSFRTNAESSVGARGLMQMMPDTAEWIAGKLDDSSYTFDSMWDAETNIRYGCWYLSYLSKLFHGDAVLVSAAYHAGQSTITQWLSDPEKSSDGVTLDLDNLSDGPTKQYIGRVTQTYGIYQTLLYPDAAFGAADSVSAGGAADASAER